MRLLAIYVRCAAILLGSVLVYTPAKAADIFIAQNAAGANSGQSCANAYAYGFFNSASNWGNGASQIGPGTTVHLCGKITAQLTAQGSGSSGSPITMFFEPGASITLSVCPSSGCLGISGLSYITVDGGATCGWVSGALVSCNGSVLATASGSAFGNGGTSSFGIEATNCAYCEIRNLQVSVYQHTSSSDSPNGDMRGIDQLGIKTPGATFLVHHNIVHEAASAIVYVPGSSNDSGLQVYNNYLYNSNSGLDISNNNNGSLTAALVHDNHFGSNSNWDTAGCAYHHNSLHAFAYTTTNSGIQYYNNLIDGNWGGCPTSELFLEGSGSLNNNCTVFNNLFLATYAQENNGVVSITCGGMVRFFNNTLIGSLQSGDTCLSIQGTSGASVYVENNIISGCNTLLESGNPANFWATWNYNVWGGDPSGTPWALSCGNSGCSYYSYSGWQSACSCDSKSTFGSSTSYVSVNTNGTLASGSPALGVGVNLSNLGIIPLDSDNAGIARPANGSWVAGAFTAGTSNAKPAPPTGISVVIR